MCIFKGIIRYRLKNTIINALLASLVQKFCKKNAPYNKGGSLPLIAAPAPPGLTSPLRAGFRRQPATPGFKLPLQSIKQILLTNHFSLCNIRFALSQKR